MITTNQPAETVLVYAGGNLGLGFDNVVIQVETPSGRADIPLELALRHIDLFAEPGRSRILAQLEYQFDLTGGRKSSDESRSWAVSFAGATIPFNTRSEAKRFIRDAKKDVADQRGGTFNAVIVRIPAHDAGKEAIH
ncbi:hypothetical protein [Pseudoduganella namucuonensis]|uniref:Uncharacterized protein n=1 Tax=Pseudoduganella namucuonensis TaxID=1035707 RepID=A0A1I7M0N6_9BURK|nr:hypothetical protein [Pseudoduganella namucuonensis]SFV15498.1 hypothetical protein SAMN05216552_104630 [Pseudoduganella namucuonensis]